jgi:hypothetical protein
MSARLRLYLTGGAQNADPAKSLGGTTSNVYAPADLFADVPEAECLAGRVDYRAVDLVNQGDQGARRVAVWCEGGGLEIAATSTADVETKDGTQPPWNHGAYTAFAAHDVDSPLLLPDIFPTRAIRIWAKRVVAKRSEAADVTATIDFRYV